MLYDPHIHDKDEWKVCWMVGWLNGYGCSLTEPSYIDYRFIVLTILPEVAAEAAGGGDRGVCMGVRQRRPDDRGDFNPSPPAMAVVLPEEMVVLLFRGTATRSGGGGEVAGFR